MSDIRRPTRRQFLSSFGALAATTAAGAWPLVGSGRLRAAEARRRPNILLIVADDLGWKDLSCMGSDYYETPHIDRLADQGMLFQQAYANAPVCAPARACMLSGQYSSRHGVYTVWKSARGEPEHMGVIPPENVQDLPPTTVTLAEELKRTGYTTAHIGKWHLGNDPQAGPKSQGFDVNIAGHDKGMPKTYFSPYNLPHLENGPDGEYLTERLTDEAIGFMADHRDEPFFLHMSYYSVHCLAEGKLEAEPEMIDRFRDKVGAGRQSNPTYAAMVAHLDEGVGRLMQSLDELGLAEDTLVVFWSDNGGWGPGTDAPPLRGQKGMAYENGIRVPMIARWPGRIEPGTVSETPVMGMDLYPSLLEAAGGKPGSGQVIDGESLVPLWTGQGQPDREALYWHFPAYLPVWPDNWTLEGERWRTTPFGAVRVGEWKLIEYFEGNRLELYNLHEDPGETTNLAQRHPAVVKQLHEQMVQWRRETGAAMPEPNPAYRPEPSASGQ